MSKELDAFARYFDPVSIVNTYFKAKEIKELKKKQEEEEKKREEDARTILSLLGLGEPELAGYLSPDGSYGVSKDQVNKQYFLDNPEFIGAEPQFYEPKSYTGKTVRDELKPLIEQYKDDPQRLLQILMPLGDTIYESDDVSDVLNPNELAQVVQLMSERGYTRPVMEDLGKETGVDYSKEIDFFMSNPDIAREMSGMLPINEALQESPLTDDEFIRFVDILKGGVTKEEYEDAPARMKEMLRNPYMETALYVPPEQPYRAPIHVGSGGGYLVDQSGNVQVFPPISKPEGFGDTKDVGARVDAAVSAYTNTPYKLGGENVGGADCSGFAWDVLKQIGFNIPRFTTKSVYEDTGQYFMDVGQSELRPGDVIIWASGRGPNGMHMGIINSKGKAVDLGSSGLRETPLYGEGALPYDILAIKRPKSYNRNINESEISMTEKKDWFYSYFSPEEQMSIINSANGRAIAITDDNGAVINYKVSVEPPGGLDFVIRQMYNEVNKNGMGQTLEGERPTGVRENFTREKIWSDEEFDLYVDALINYYSDKIIDSSGNHSDKAWNEFLELLGKALKNIGSNMTAEEFYRRISSANATVED